MVAMAAFAGAGGGEIAPSGPEIAIRCRGFGTWGRAVAVVRGAAPLPSGKETLSA
jgi:hypothetical protein